MHGWIDKKNLTLVFNILIKPGQTIKKAVNIMLGYISYYSMDLNSFINNPL